MINFQFNELATLDHEYSDTVEEAEKLLFWVTDRLGIVNEERYELIWGNIVLLMAAFGKLNMIERVAAEKAIELPDGEIRRKRRATTEYWSQYLEDFRVELEQELDEQFETSVVSSLRNRYDGCDTLNEIHELEYFFAERDTVELFLVGREGFFDLDQRRDQVEEIDTKIRDYVSRVVVESLGHEYSITTLEELNLSWLPKRFWWRHIIWH